MTQRYLSDVHRRLHENAVQEIRAVVDRLPYEWVQILSLVARLLARDVLHDDGGGVPLEGAEGAGADEDATNTPTPVAASVPAA